MTDSAGPHVASLTPREGAVGGEVVELVSLVSRRLPPDDASRRGMDRSHAVTGELMRLPSRRRMQEAIDGALERLRAGGDPSAVLLIDVEKRTAGGERWLITLGERLAACLGPDDLVARFDGDVFVIVAREVADEPAAHALAARLKRTLERPVDRRGTVACVQASVGVSLVREDDPSVGAVVARADAAMYAARNKAWRDARGNQPGPRESDRQALVEAAFECSSIEDFDVYYQPIADLRGGSIAAIEAILHWEHANLGSIAPDEFLPIAERVGQMVTLGRWAIERACAQTVRWAATRDGLPMRTCFRVSPSQVSDPAFVEDVEAAIARSGATGQQLSLEISEDTLAAVPAGVFEALAAARVALILDHVSPASFASLPIGMVKLDRLFVSPRAGDRSPPVLSPAAELAPSLGLPAVADGVETLDQLAAVIESGFPLAQGNLFSRPQSAAAVEALVQRERPFAALLAPRPAWLDLAPGHEPDVAVDAVMR